MGDGRSAYILDTWHSPKVVLSVCSEAMRSGGSHWMMTRRLNCFLCVLRFSCHSQRKGKNVKCSVTKSTSANPPNPAHSQQSPQSSRVMRLQYLCSLCNVRYIWQLLFRLAVGTLGHILPASITVMSPVAPENHLMPMLV